MAGSSAQAKLREALTGGSSTAAKEKGPQPTDGVLTITPDTPEAARIRRSVVDCAFTTSDYLEQKDGASVTERVPSTAPCRRPRPKAVDAPSKYQHGSEDRSEELIQP